ncbi:phosphate ABC transporter permease subunit PstC [Isoptericola jiangsuensis]|uniref:phosphate ABC transporter permease subunit PstC n=1 Tax=Isoptericola jiangsuensis TaxID=548579 RepID=UPI003AAC8266
MSSVSTTAGRATMPGRPTGAGILRSGSRRGETMVRAVLRAAAFLSVAITVGIVIALLEPALAFFAQVPLGEFLTGTRWTPRFADASYGVLPLVTATAWTTLIAISVAVPFGLGAAIYLSEYAPERVRRTLKPILELLAGIPTVVFGFFALTWFAPVVLQGFLKLDVGPFSILSAGAVMGVMIIPTVASLSEDAMSAVPQSLRQGSAALGANRMQTSLRVVVPAAFSGIVAAIVLGISRAIGETMIVTIAGGQMVQMVSSPLQQGATMTTFIANAALGDSRVGSLEYDTLFAVGLLLFVLTLIVNLVAIQLVRRFRQEY